ncbi:MAG: RNA 2',3'-cyclic phosphodiesterase [Anaerolineales bacterium]
MSSATLRTFTALNLPAELHLHLGEIAAVLQKTAPRGSVRWVRPEGIHLTLKFYGEVSSARIPDLQRVLSEAAGACNRLTFALGGLGAFPNMNNPRVVWVGLTGDMPALQRLQRTVEEGSQRLGFAPEARRFNPHLTLGRVNQPLPSSDQSVLTQMLRQAAIAPGESFSPGEPFVLDTLTLWHSELRSAGSVYTPLFSSGLGRLNRSAMLE